MGKERAAKASPVPLYFASGATVAILGLGGALALFIEHPWLTEEKLLRLEHVGAFIGGLCAVITIIWLIATLLMQLEELSLQRQEISRQRIAWDAASSSIRGQMVLALVPTMLVRLAGQAKSLARLTYPDVSRQVTSPAEASDEQYVHFLLAQPSLEDRLSELRREGDLVAVIHVSSYARIFSEFERIVKDDVQSAWPIAVFLPEESAYVRLLGRLRAYLTTNFKASDEEIRTSPEFS